VLFLERDVPWYAENRDLPSPPYGRTELYGSVTELKERFGRTVRDADLVLVGSYVPDGVAVGEWVLATAEGMTAFYDIDTPVTLAKLKRGEADYISPELIRRYRMYLSFTGGPTLGLIERRYRSPMARVLYCSVDSDVYRPEVVDPKWDLGYIGTYSQDRQPFLDCLMLEPARRWPAGRFVVAGPLYPEDTPWPANVERVDHLSPQQHRSFYNSQRVTLNLTRVDMKAAGYSPSVRLFEAAACGTPIISDYWRGLESIFTPGEEVLVAACPDEVLRYLRDTPAKDLQEVGERARARVLASHTAAHRARELEVYFEEAVAYRTTV
jgi:spore maturation protein CgeB